MPQNQYFLNQFIHLFIHQPNNNIFRHVLDNCTKGIAYSLQIQRFKYSNIQYFIDYKFKPLEVNATVPEYSKYFFSYLGVCSQLPNLLLNLLNLFVVLKADLSKRIVFSLIIVAASCVFTIIFIFVDTFSCKFLLILL